MGSLYGDPQFGSISNQKLPTNNLIEINFEIIIKRN